MFKKNYKIKLGFAPTRRSLAGEKAFNKSEANKFKDIIEEKLKAYGTDYVNLNFLNGEGLLYSGLDVDKVAQKFISEGVDAIFAPHCNFGTEDAVAKLAKRMNLPLLIWGPRDDKPDEEGYRYRDSQCGMFATTKLLLRMGVPFTYITNCSVDDPLFARCFENFMRAASAVKALRNPRIGQISIRPDVFWSVKCNEGELLERFGIEIVTMTLPEFKKRFEAVQKENKDEISAIVEKMKSTVSKVNFGEEYLSRIAALEMAVLNWAEDEGLTAAASQCWAPMYDVTGLAPCVAFSELTEVGLPTICEVDIHGAITSLMVQAAAMGQSSTFFADVTIRHPSNDNAELFWHCGVFPKSLAKDGIKPELCIHYNRKAPAVNHLELKGGDITIARFDGARGEYSLLMGHGRGTTGPKTFGSYAWIEFNDWPLWEHKFIYGPYIHHCTGVHGKFAPALYEACRYIPGLKPDPVEPTAQEIEKYLRG